MVAVTLLFLASLRAGAISLLAIPLSLLAAVVGLRALGLSINSMTLGGMAIAVGALVDDAIIDVENVGRRLRENARRPAARQRPVLKVVFDASREIRTSIVFATLIVGLVMLPIFFLAGVEGRLLQPLGIVYLIALAASLLVALTLTPVLCFYLLPGSRAASADHEPALAAAVRRRYSRLLPHALRHPRTVLVAAGRPVGGGGGGDSVPGARVPARVQRGRPRDQRRHPAGDEPRRVERPRERHRAAPPRGARGCRHRPADGTGRA